MDGCNLVATSEWGISHLGVRGWIVLLLPPSGESPFSGRIDGCTMMDGSTAIEECNVMIRRIK